MKTLATIILVIVAAIIILNFPRIRERVEQVGNLNFDTTRSGPLYKTNPVLEFKGMRLGMTLDEIDTLLTTANLEYELKPDPSKPDQDISIEPFQRNQDPNFDRIGYYMDNGEVSCHWKRAMMGIHNRRVYSIDVMGDALSDKDPDAWMQVALSGLKQKYGEPTYTYNKDKYSDAKTAAIWSFASERVSVGTMEPTSGLCGYMLFTDRNATDEVEKLREKPNPTF